MSKFIVYFNKDMNQYEVRKVAILSETPTACQVKVDDKVFFKKKDAIYDSRDYAEIVKKEITISRNFKNSLKGKEVYCKICGRKISDHDDSTIDHVIPKKHYKRLARRSYNTDDYRLVDELWEDCWKRSNLQLVCKGCNVKKASKNTVLNNYLFRKSYLSKKYEAVNRNNRKVHLRGVGGRMCNSMKEDVLKQFGNTFDMRAIKKF